VDQTGVQDALGALRRPGFATEEGRGGYVEYLCAARRGMVRAAVCRGRGAGVGWDCRCGGATALLEGMGDGSSRVERRVSSHRKQVGRKCVRSVM
jgi:hypothetical protein